MAQRRRVAVKICFITSASRFRHMWAQSVPISSGEMLWIFVSPCFIPWGFVLDLNVCLRIQNVNCRMLLMCSNNVIFHIEPHSCTLKKIDKENAKGPGSLQLTLLLAGHFLAKRFNGMIESPCYDAIFIICVPVLICYLI